MAKGQFYIIASVFIMISLTALFLFTVFVDFGSLTLPSQSTDFDNLQNAIHQENIWLPTYWWNLTWKTRTIVNISGGFTNPIEIDARITTGCDSTRVFQKSSGTFTEIASNISTELCNVTFSAPSAGVYEIYWNGSDMGKQKSDGNESVTITSKVIEQRPANICNSFSSLLPKKNIAFNCSATPISNTYNYSVGFTATDFTYIGNLS